MGLAPNVDAENYMLADVFTLTDDLVFEAYNPDAILSCFATARENARQTSNNITCEMWTCLNVSYLEMRDVRLQDIWDDQPEDFLAKAALAWYNGCDRLGDANPHDIPDFLAERKFRTYWFRP